MREAAEAEAAKEAAASAQLQVASASAQLLEASLQQPQSASSASTGASTSGAAHVGGAAEEKITVERSMHESSTHRFRAGTSKANRALNANTAADSASEAGSVQHHKRVALPASKLGAHPRMYGHSR